MTDTSPKPAPPPSAKEERIKLRSACDRCSLNKIKCSQDKPECQRCKTIGAQCHYSRSMRMGKPRKSAKAKAMMNAKIPGSGDATASGSSHLPGSNGDDAAVVPTTELSWSAEWSFDHLLAAHDHMVTGTSSDTSMAPFQALFDQPTKCLEGDAVVSTTDLMNVDSLSVEFGHHASQTDDAFLSLPQSPAGAQKPIKEDSENVYLSPSSYYAPSMDSTLLSTGSSPFEDLGPSLLSQQNTHNCTYLALETITSLCLPSTVQKTTEGQPRPTIDQVLKINNDAMKNVSTILACSCSRDSSLPLLLSTIFNKALAWYRAVVDSHNLTMGNGEPAQNVKEEVVHRPISVGGYELDDESSDLMKIQLVLSRLRMMSKPLKTYLEEYSSATLSHTHPSSLPTPSGSPTQHKSSSSASVVRSAQMYSTLANFIQGNLQSTIEELQSKLSVLGGHL